jgi:hypothetical protein
MVGVMSGGCHVGWPPSRVAACRVAATSGGCMSGGRQVGWPHVGWPPHRVAACRVAARSGGRMSGGCQVGWPPCRVAAKQPFPFTINFVKSFAHLGHQISVELNDDEDIIRPNGRNAFIDQANSAMCYFSKLESFVKMHLFQSFCTSYYGCELYGHHSMHGSAMQCYGRLHFPMGTCDFWTSGPS